MFRAVVEYEKSDFVKFSKFHLWMRKKSQSVILRAQLIATFLMEAMLLYLVIISSDVDEFIIVILFLVPGLMALILLMPRIQATGMMKTYRQLGIQTMCFIEDQISIETPTSRAAYLYNAFEELDHADGVYYLYLNRMSAVVLPERCFVEGDPADFGAFISEKTGLELKEIK